MNHTRIYLVVILLVGFLLSALGIRWGAPDENKIRLVFGNREVLSAFVPEMVKGREEIREMIFFGADKYATGYNERQAVTVEMKSGKMTVTKSTFNAMRTFLLRTYYPDEHMMLIALSNMSIRKMDFNPRIYSYGGAYIYPTGLWLGVCAFFRCVKPVGNVAYYLNNPTEMGRIYAAGRMLGVFATLAIMVLLYLIGKNFFHQRVGLIAAFLFGVTPLIVVRNHYFSPYVFALFFVVASLYFSFQATAEDRLKNYILAGLLSGIAAGAVVIFGLSLVFPMFAGGLYYFSNRTRSSVKIILKGFCFSVVAAGVGFILTNPYLLVSGTEFLKEMQFNKASFLWELEQFKTFHRSIPPFVYYLLNSLKTGFGWPLLLAALAGLFTLKRKERRRENLLLALSFLLTLVFLGVSSPWFVRRSILLTPFLVLAAGNFFNLLFVRPAWKPLGMILLAVVIGYNLLFSLAYDRIFLQKNVRDEAGAWINSNLPEGKSIGLVQMPAPYRTPPFAFYKFRLLSVGLNKNLLEKEKPAYLILNEYDLLGTKKETLEGLTANYVLSKKFEKPAQIFGLKFNRTDFSAKDWWQPNPYILIFKRKN